MSHGPWPDKRYVVWTMDTEEEANAAVQWYQEKGVGSAEAMELPDDHEANWGVVVSFRGDREKSEMLKEQYLTQTLILGSDSPTSDLEEWEPPWSEYL